MNWSARINYCYPAELAVSASRIQHRARQQNRQQAAQPKISLATF